VEIGIDLCGSTVMLFWCPKGRKRTDSAAAAFGKVESAFRNAV
jgi:hypothetical protein